jgi:sensor histidine kinase YesM
MKSVILIILFLLYYSVSLYAQDPVYTVFNKEDGIPSNIVYYVMQDSKGYIWISTDAGIARFNGTTFTNYTKDDGLADNEIFQLKEDSKGRLWQLCSNGKVSYIQNDVIHNHINTPFLEEIDGLNFMRAFHEDKAHNIWLGSHMGSIYKISNEKVEVINHTNFENGFRCLDFFENEGKTILFGANGRLVTVSPELKIDVVDAIMGMFQHFSIDENKSLLASDKRVLIYDHASRSADEIIIEGVVPTAETITHISYRDEQIWIGTWSGLIQLKKEGEGYTTRTYFKGTPISYVFNDNQGNLWVTSLGEGLFLIPNLEALNLTKQLGYSTNYINCITALTENSIWVGGNDLNLGHFNADLIFQKITLTADSTGRGMINTAKSLKDGSIVVGTDQGFVLLKDNEQLIVPELGVKSFLEEKENILLVGSGQSLTRLDTRDLQKVSALNEKRYEILLNKRVEKIIRISEQKLLLGSREGLHLFDLSTIKLSAYYPDYFSDVSITDIKISGNQIWISSNGNGVYVIENDQLTNYTSKDGLLTNNCKQLIVGDKTIYIATSEGISTIQKSNRQISSILKEDGILSNDIVSLFLAKNNKLWVGTSAGLCVYPVLSEQTKQPDIPFFIAKIFAGGKRLNTTTSKLELKPGQRTLKVEMNALYYRKAQKLTYRYKLSGLEEKWNYSSISQLEYEYIPPGEYQLIIDVLLDGKVINSKPITLAVNVQFTFWETWWFYASMALLLLVITGLIAWRIISGIRAREKLKRMALASQQQALKTQMNPHFIFNSLNSIQYYIAENNERAALTYLSKFSKLIRKILATSSQETLLLNDEIELLEGYLAIEQLRLEHKFEYNIDKGNVSIENRIPGMIIQPFIENAIWHGMQPLKGRKGLIIVKFSNGGNSVKCIIEDNGIGRSAASKKPEHDSIGLMNTEMRLKVLNEINKGKSEITIHDLFDEEGKPSGTRVEITLALKQEL